MAVRRRRECLACGRRYTTFERVEVVALRIAKRAGRVEPFDRLKVIEGIHKACKNRPVTAEQIERLADNVEEELRAKGSPEVASQDVGITVLEHLRDLDPVAYMRFASVYKDFQELTDFEREVGLLLQKRTPPKATAQR